MSKVLIIFVLVFSGCSLIYPLKRVKNIKTKNQIVKEYGANFKYLGEVNVNFPKVLNNAQKRHLKDRIESNIFKDNSDNSKVQLKDYRFEKQKYVDYIKNNSFFTSPKQSVATKKYLEFFVNKSVQYKAHLFLINRVKMGLEKADNILSIVEVDNKIQLAFFDLCARYDISQVIKTNLYTLPYLSYYNEHKSISNSVSTYLEEYLNIFMEKRIGDTEDIKEKYNQLDVKYGIRD